MTHSIFKLSISLMAILMLQFFSLQHGLDHFENDVTPTECHLCVANQTFEDFDDSFVILLPANKMLAAELVQAIVIRHSLPSTNSFAIRAPPYLSSTT